MTRDGTSLRLRLLIGTFAAVGAAMLVAGLFTSSLFAAHVQRTVEEDLTHHLSELIVHTRIAPDGTVTVTRPLSDPRFQQPASGMTWRIAVDGAGALGSASSAGAARTASRRTVERSAIRAMNGRTVAFTIREDGRLLEREIAGFHADLALSLAALALLLTGGVLIQQHHGLRPLDRLAQAVDALRRGRLGRLPEDVPAELRGLVARINALIDSQSVLIARGRLEAGNLAHGLRTPLALIGDEVERLRRSGQREAADFIQQQCDAMGRQVDYCMRRAAAGGTGHEGGAVPLAPMLARIGAAMDRLHRDHGKAVRVAVAPNLSVQCDPGDLFEILSNLIDNAYKWARSQIEIAASAQDDAVSLTIADDGPGIAEERRTAVLAAGARLDEDVPGHGLGLAIAFDLVAMNGGAMRLDRSAALGGLAVTLVLRPPVER